MGYDSPRGLSYKAFTWPSHPDHKYIWIRGGTSTIKQFTSGRGGVWPKLASQTIPNIKFLSFVVSEICVILKICTFSIKTMILQEKKQ